MDRGGQDYGRGCEQEHGLCEPEYGPRRTVAWPWLDENVAWDTQKYDLWWRPVWSRADRSSVRGEQENG